MTALPLIRVAPGLSRTLPLRLLGNETGKGLTLLRRRWLMLVMAAVSGYALLIAGLAVNIASIGAITHVFNMAIMFFGGMFFPIAIFPQAVLVVARLMPTALGVQVLNTTLAGRGLSAAWADGTLPWLLAHVAVLTALAWAVYLRGIARGMRKGRLSR